MRLRQHGRYEGAVAMQISERTGEVEQRLPVGLSNDVFDSSRFIRFLDQRTTHVRRSGFKDVQSLNELRRRVKYVCLRTLPPL